MYDLDIQRILFAGEDAKAKTIFIERLGKTTDEIENSIQSDFGEVLPIGISGLISAYDKVISTYTAKNETETWFAFDELEVQATGHPLRDDDLFNLLLKGEVRTDAVWDKVNSSATQQYFIARDQIETSAKAISDGAVNILAIADLANGKSLFCLGLACKLSSQGHRAFWLRDDAEDLAGELDRICDLPGKILVVVENYTRKINDLRSIQFRRSKDLVLILSAKTSLHEVYQSDLQDFS